MHNKEQVPSKEGKEEFTEAELLSLIEALKTKLDVVEKEHGGMPKMYEEHNRLFEEFIENLLQEKDRFQHIFKTERGSVYFVLQSGKTFRIKKMKYEYELQPITDNIIYLSEDGVSGELALGARPLETLVVEHNKRKEQMIHRGHDITEIIK